MSRILSGRTAAVRAALCLILCQGSGSPARAAAEAEEDRLMLCGMDEIFLIRADLGEAPAGAAPRALTPKLWAWRASDHPEIPEDMRKSFATTDETKFLEGGRKILLTSSSGGCALLEYPSGKPLWHARVPNAHSIEALPGNRVVVASSVAREGDLLVLFDLGHSGEALASTPLPSAHGVIWDGGTRRLWALGFDELRRYALTEPEGADNSPEPADSPDSAPEKESTGGTDKSKASNNNNNSSSSAGGKRRPAPGFRLEAAFRWPGNGGHDLQDVPGSADLLLSCEAGIWLFDRKSETFRPHPNPDLAKLREVKSLSIHPGNGRIALTKAEGGDHWWTQEVNLLSPPSKIILPLEKIYKVRWFPGNPAGAQAAGEREKTAADPAPAKAAAE